MVPVDSVRLQLGDLLAADATTLAPAMNPNKIALIAQPFTPAGNLTLAALTLATFTGSAPKAGAAGAQGVGVDPTTGEQVITILPPAGGFIFKCTVAPGSPETIYGYALVDNAVTNLLATALLSQPVTIRNVNDQVDVDDATLRFVVQPLS